MSATETTAQKIAQEMDKTVPEGVGIALLTILAIVEFIATVTADLYSCYKTQNNQSILNRMQSPYIGDRLHVQMVARASLERHQAPAIGYHMELANAAQKVAAGLTEADVAGLVAELPGATP